MENPPSEKELKSVLKLLGLGARELLRKGEDEYKELKLADKSLGEAKLIDAMVKHPRLIERPIVIGDGKAAKIGRPPEDVLELVS